MNRPARRDGTPARKNRQGTSGGAAKKSSQPTHTSRRVQQNRTSASGKSRSTGTTTRQRGNKNSLPRTSSARPSRHQMVTPDNPVKLLDPSPRFPQEIRLQKYLAQAGVASRRVSEELIAAGRVQANGEVVRQQGVKVNPANAIVHVDGERVIAREEHVYLVLNKPRGYLSTMADDQGRACVGDIVAERVNAGQRLFHVGRLDQDTEGLLLLTNDGELAHRLMHPSYEVPKTYLATVRGVMGQRDARKLRQGIVLDDGPIAADELQIMDTLDGKTLLRVVVHEGRNRIVRRMLAEIGFPVIELVRTRLGGVTLGNQRSGSLRKLSNKEVASLYEAVHL